MIKKIFLGFSVICTLYFSVSAVGGLYTWGRVSERAWAYVTSWGIIEISPSQFAIEAEYSYEFQKKTYNGMTRFPKPYFFNRPSAEKELQKMKGSSLIAHFDPKQPAISSLYRTFPLKKCLYALLTIGISMYFVFLDRMFLEKRVQKT